MRRDRSLLLPPQPQGRLPNYFVKIHKPVLRFAVRRLQHLSSTVYPAVCRSRPSPIPRSAVCRPPSIFVYSLPHSLTVCPPDRLKPVLRCAARRLQHLSSTIHPAVCRSCLSPAVCSLPSAVHIRLFVAPFVDGLPPRQARKPVLRCASSTVHRPSRGLPSAVRGLSLPPIPQQVAKPLCNSIASSSKKRLKSSICPTPGDC
jgi:hypothetical protein